MKDLAKVVLALLACLSLAGFAACGDDDDGSAGGGGGENLSGSIAIDGSSTVQPFAEAAAELFNEEAPEVQITVGGAGTGDGFEKFCRGETQISDASREIEPEEEQACREGDVEPVQVQVANDGLSVVTNPSLEVDCLTVAQLKDIFGPDATAQRYSDVDPGLPDAEVDLYTPGEESGTFDFFTEVALETDAEQRRENVQTSADDNVLVRGITGSDSGMGYFGFSYAEENKDQLNIVKIDDGDGECVEPTLDTVQNNTYEPLSRPLFMYPSRQALQRPEVKAFMDFVLRNEPRIAEAAGVVPMTEDQLMETTAKFERQAGQ